MPPCRTLPALLQLHGSFVSHNASRFSLSRSFHLHPTTHPPPTVTATRDTIELKSRPSIRGSHVNPLLRSRSGPLIRGNADADITSRFSLLRNREASLQGDSANRRLRAGASMASKETQNESTGMRGISDKTGIRGISDKTQIPRFDALLVDVGGTLLETCQPVPAVYAQFGRKHGIDRSETEIKAGFKKAFSIPWHRKLRYEGGGEDFWKFAVATAMGSENEELFQDLYQHFSSGDAWRVAEGAVDSLQRLRDAQVKLAVVSNFDTRLRPILKDLQLDQLFDSIVVSCEVLSEKPDPEIFRAALESLDISDPSRAIHLGDDPLNDVRGARDVGMEAWLWKADVMSFNEVVNRILQAQK